MKLKQLHLQNYCGYRDTTYDFNTPQGVKPLVVFHGPNGCGKSTALQAIRSLACPWQYVGRKNDMLFRKITYHDDYDPTYAKFQTSPHPMRISGIFTEEGKDYEVVISSDGVEKNDLPRDRQFEYALWIDADHPMEMIRFQTDQEVMEQFLDMAHTVYGYPSSLKNEVEEYDSERQKYVTFLTDFIITKMSKMTREETRVHFKNMSAGEKKIATLIRMLCNPTNQNRYSIYLIDNCMMHIHWERHIRTVEKLQYSFPQKQFIMTTHSGTLIKALESSCTYDIRDYT